MRKAYYGSITYLDYSIGKILTWLKNHGLYNDTLIVFSSDHGELLGDHHLYRKITPFEGAARIPMIIKGTSGCRRNDRTDVPMSHFDVMPTLLDFAGIPIPDDVDGMSMLPLVQGGTKPDRTWIHGEHCGYDDNGWQFLVSRDRKYIWNTSTGREYFFDLARDPQERTNLAADPAFRTELAQFRSRLVSILAQRPEDGLTRDGQLTPGKVLDPVRPDFLANSNRLKAQYGLR